MDVFLTACCCSLVPTPTSSNIRAHNLLQAHSVFTNLLLMSCLGVCMFLSIDYNLPIINRPWQLSYSSTYFYNYALIAIVLLPASMIMYAVFKKLIGSKDDIITRNTLFWRDKKPTLAAVLTGVVSTVVLTLLLMINVLGRYSSSHCDPGANLTLHGVVTSLNTGIGVSVQCHHNYMATPAANVYCSWFFGPEGYVDILPAYHKQLTNPKKEDEDVDLLNHDKVDDSFAFVRNMTDLGCIKKEPQLYSCVKEDRPCNVNDLLETNVDNGEWVCRGISCVLHCKVFHEL